MMQNDWSLHPARIGALVQSETMRTDAPTEEWVEALDTALSQYGPAPLLAWAKVTADHDRTATYDADEFTEHMERTYRQAWPSPGAFVRDKVASDEASMGETGESTGFERCLEMFGEFIDWEAAADKPRITGDFTLVTLDPDGEDEPDTTVYAFELEA